MIRSVLSEGLVLLACANGSYPAWAPLSTVFILAPCSYLGGMLRAVKRTSLNTSF